MHGALRARGLHFEVWMGKSWMNSKMVIIYLSFFTFFLQSLDVSFGQTDRCWQVLVVTTVPDQVPRVTIWQRLRLIGQSLSELQESSISVGESVSELLPLCSHFLWILQTHKRLLKFHIRWTCEAILDSSGMSRSQSMPYYDSKANNCSSMNSAEV